MGRQGIGLLSELQRLLRAVVLGQQQRQIIQGSGPFGSQADHPTQRCNCGIPRPDAALELSDPLQNLDVVGPMTQVALEIRHCALVVTATAVIKSACAQGLRLIRVQEQGAIEGCQGVLLVSPFQQDPGPHCVEGGRQRRSGGRIRGLCDGAIDPGQRRIQRPGRRRDLRVEPQSQGGRLNRVSCAGRQRGLVGKQDRLCCVRPPLGQERLSNQKVCGCQAWEERPVAPRRRLGLFRAAGSEKHRHKALVIFGDGRHSPGQGFRRVDRSTPLPHVREDAHQCAARPRIQGVSQGSQTQPTGGSSDIARGFERTAQPVLRPRLIELADCFAKHCNGRIDLAPSQVETPTDVPHPRVLQRDSGQRLDHRGGGFEIALGQSVLHVCNAQPDVKGERLHRTGVLAPCPSGVPLRHDPGGFASPN